MPRSSVNDDGSLKRRTKVQAKVDLPSRQPGELSVPEGMDGKVAMVSGFGPWVRYWVRFENGQLIGSLDRDVLHAPAVDDPSDKEVSWLFR